MSEAQVQDRLDALAALVARWSPRINLVAPSTLPALATRHVADSTQLWPLIPDGTETLADLGSGGGFPGLVLACLAAEHGGPHVTLIESDGRKCAFLRTAARELALDVTILDQRIEEAPPQGADVVTARALAPLDRLLPLVHRHLREGGTAILPKGRDWEREAAPGWHYDLDARPSVTDPEARVLVLKDLRRG